MVDRKESSGMLDEFDGKVTKVELETGLHGPQYHIFIAPTSFEVGGVTKSLHEWVPMSPTAKEDEVPQGSVMDRYLTQVEICISAAKKSKTVKDALGLLVGKSFRFKRLKLGRDYDGHQAKEYIVPVVSL